MAQFTVGVLLYGDFPQLARRCLGSLLTQLPRHLFHLRLGLNQVSAGTESYIHELQAEGLLLPEDAVYYSRENLKKYPMMRRMVHDPVDPVTSEYFMWFDDDSYLHPGLNGSAWLEDIRTRLLSSAMLGAVYHIPLQGNQAAWIQDQPWFNGLPPKSPVRFCTGGWWVIRTEILQRFDWPVSELLHRGGDVMLGELLRQHALPVGHFTDGVAINADAQGRQCKAKRRGYDSRPVGADYESGISLQLHHTTQPRELP